MSFPLIYHSSLSAHFDAYGPYFFSAMTKHNKYTVEGYWIDLQGNSSKNVQFFKHYVLMCLYFSSKFERLFHF